MLFLFIPSVISLTTTARNVLSLLRLQAAVLTSAVQVFKISDRIELGLEQYQERHPISNTQ